MAHEIERVFLLANDSWRGLAEGVPYRQGYLSSKKDCTVRVRMAGNRAWITVKGRTVHASRLEFEYPIPLEDAREMLEKLAQQPLIEKIRYAVPYKGLIWEVDEFLGANKGLLTAEVELTHAEQRLEKPDWVGEEVTGDPRYYNANLVKTPYADW